jgi:hypothetical protein
MNHHLTTSLLIHVSKTRGTLGDPIRGIAAISGRFADSQRTDESQRWQP